MLLSPPPVDEHARLRHQKAKYGEKATGICERTNANAQLYVDECSRVASKVRAGFVDVFCEFLGSGSLQAFLSDGLHLSDHGDRVVFERVLAHMVDAKLGPENFAKRLPICVRVPRFPRIAEHRHPRATGTRVSKLPHLGLALAELRQARSACIR